MAHFAEIGLDNIVLRVLVVNNSELLDENGEEQEHLGATFLQNLFGGTWVQTSYNSNFRKQFASANYTYNSSADVFIAPQPFPSWTLDSNYDWQPPTPAPTEGAPHYWNEETLTWEEF